jgi:type II secretory pathway component GspD/PulD (secretin)
MTWSIFMKTPKEIRIPNNQPQALAGANALSLVLCAIATLLLPFLASARPIDDAQTVTNPPGAPAVAATDATAATPATTTATNAASPSDAKTNPEPAPAASANVPSTNADAETLVDYGTNGLRPNFHGAPLDIVLKYMAKAAGFVINPKTDNLHGTVDLVSSEPLTKEEALQLLGSQLEKNGYSMVRNGRILTIEDPERAKYNTPIEQITWPNMPKEDSDEMVTEIIPVRYANVEQLTANLQVLLPTTATLSANLSANSLLLVATRTDVRRMVQIINALDTSIASVSSIRVFLLKYEDAKDLATLVTQLFAPQNSNQGGNNGGGGRGGFFRMFGGGGGFPGGGFPGGGAPGGGAPGGGSGSSGGAAAKNVQAVGDERANALIVTAPSDLLETIAQMVDKIDQPVSDITQLRVFTVKYADPMELANEITSLYPDDTTTGNQSSGLPFIFRGPFGGGGGGGQRNQPDERARKLGRVLAVPEPRTKKLMVTAPNVLMPQIADMIESLDVKGQQEIVGIYDLENADPQDVEQALSDLFNRSNVRMNTSSSTRSSMLGQNNPLTQRETSQQQSMSTTTTLGTSGGGGGRGLGQ